jgi:hypothetical protein
MPMPRARTLLAAALLVSAAGCGADAPPNVGPPSVTVTGKVTLAGGKPLPGGLIRFQLASAANWAGSGKIMADGTYEATFVPIGECKVSVDNASLKPSSTPPTENSAPDPSLKYVPINAKYANPHTSGLTFNVASDNQIFNVELK